MLHEFRIMMLILEGKKRSSMHHIDPIRKD